MNCPTCGQAVEVHNGDEGTNSYIGLELKNGLELAADKLEKLTMSEIRLATGEFGAETARVVRAVLNWQAASIRAEVAKFPKVKPDIHQPKRLRRKGGTAVSDNDTTPNKTPKEGVAKTLSDMAEELAYIEWQEWARHLAHRLKTVLGEHYVPRSEHEVLRNELEAVKGNVESIGAKQIDGIWKFPFYNADGTETLLPLTEWIAARKKFSKEYASLKAVAEKAKRFLLDYLDDIGGAEDSSYEGDQKLDQYYVDLDKVLCEIDRALGDSKS